jgi:hypothetical protein
LCHHRSMTAFDLLLRGGDPDRRDRKSPASRRHRRCCDARCRTGELPRHAMLGGEVNRDPGLSRWLPGGAPRPYTLRRSATLRAACASSSTPSAALDVGGDRAGGLVDVAGGIPTRHIHSFLTEREAVAPPPTLRKPRLAKKNFAPRSWPAAGCRDGAHDRASGVTFHRLRLVPARPGSRRSSVFERIGGVDEDGSIVHVPPPRYRRSIGAVLEAWLKPRARDRDRTGDRSPRGGTRGHSGGGIEHPGPGGPAAGVASRHIAGWHSRGGLSFAPARGARDGRHPRARAPVSVFGHGPRFWFVVATRCVQDHKVWRRWLHDHFRPEKLARGARNVRP